MINYFIPILEAYLDPNWVTWFFNPLIALAILACVPALIKQIFFWRS